MTPRESILEFLNNGAPFAETERRIQNQVNFDCTPARSLEEVRLDLFSLERDELITFKQDKITKERKWLITEAGQNELLARRK